MNSKRNLKECRTVVGFQLNRHRATNRNSTPACWTDRLRSDSAMFALNSRRMTAKVPTRSPEPMMNIAGRICLIVLLAAMLPGLSLAQAPQQQQAGPPESDN